MNASVLARRLRVMSRVSKLKPVAVVAAVSVVAGSVVVGGSGAAGGSQRGSFKVRSTLTGKKVLPHRIAWLAFPKPDTVSIDRVKFLIDGSLSWSERRPPYTYGDDGNWLVTTWLTPGLHRFTIRAVSTSGRIATKTTVASVLPAPDPPAELASTRWTRTVPAVGSNGSPVGEWVLSIDGVGWSVRDPDGYTNVVDIAYLSPGLVEARGGIWMKPADTTSVGGNGWCSNKPRTNMDYRWTVTGDTLTLMLAGPKGCGDQDEVWAGTWRRVR